MFFGRFFYSVVMSIEACTFTNPGAWLHHRGASSFISFKHSGGSRWPRGLEGPTPRRSRPSYSQPSRREDGGSLSKLEYEVPPDQRPVNELKQLKDSPLYSWATLGVGDYTKRLAILWGGVFAVLGGPIAYQTFDPVDQPLEFFLSAATGSLTIVAIANLRIFLGWKYVADRLMTATLEYEETGWYDGQFFVKPPEILTRDRLLGTYEVRPVMSRLRKTLQYTGLALIATSVSLVILIRTGSDADGVYGRGAAKSAQVQVTPDGIILSNKVKSLKDLMTDEEAARAEQEAQGGVPAYCRWEMLASECDIDIDASSG